MISQSIKLLLIEDDPKDAIFLQELLAQDGQGRFDVAHAPRLDGALQYLLENPVDVILLDLLLPDSQGLKAFQEVRSRTAAIPMVVLTGADDENLAIQAVQQGAQDYLVKGQFDALMLSKSIRYAIERERIEEELRKARGAAIPTGKIGTKFITYRVLLVEDNAVNQQVTMQQLQKLGFFVEIAGNGLEALSSLARRPFDAILMDCQMPVMDGYEATAEIRRREGSLHHTPIIALTAHALKGEREKCLAAGMDDYLRKPAGPDDLEKVLARWLEKGTAIADESPPPLPLAKKSEVRHEPSPVDLERLMEITDGNEKELRELVELYLTQASEQVENLVAAVQNGAAADVRQIAHKCGGSSATCGVNALITPLRALERMGNEGQLDGAQDLVEKVVRQFAEVKTFFSKRFPSLPPALISQSTPLCETHPDR